MRLKLRHVTTYTYSSPAAGAMQILRLTPRNHIGQFVRSWRIETDVDALLKRDEDAYGNITHDFNVEGPITSMQIIVDGEIETHDQNGHVAGAIERFPAAY